MQIAPIPTVLLNVFARRVTPVMESHVAVRLTNFIDGLTGRGTVHNLTQSREEFTRTRNKTKQQLINEWVSKKIVIKYHQGEIFFCLFFHLFLIVEYANNFQIATREWKRRILFPWIVLISELIYHYWRVWD